LDVWLATLHFRWDTVCCVQVFRTLMEDLPVRTVGGPDTDRCMQFTLEFILVHHTPASRFPLAGRRSNSGSDWKCAPRHSISSKMHRSRPPPHNALDEGRSKIQSRKHPQKKLHVTHNIPSQMPLSKPPQDNAFVENHAKMQSHETLEKKLHVTHSIPSQMPLSRSRRDTAF